MGQAKLRGPREVRVQEGIKKVEEAKAQRLKEIAEREAAKTPEQKRTEMKARQKLGLLFAAAATASGIRGPFR